MTIDVEDGDLSWTEAAPVNIISDRGVLDHARLANEVPIEWRFSMKYQSHTLHVSPSPYDALTQTGGASSWTSDEPNSDAYAVIIEFTMTDPAGGASEVVTFVRCFPESIEFTERAAEVGCHAVMAVTPYYSKPPQEGIFRHMTAIADATDLPLMVYNIPGRTCRLIEVETLQRLAAHPNIVAVKDAVDDVAWTTEQIAALPDGFAVYSGSDDLTLEIVRAGGVGVVSVASHLAGVQISAMIEAALADKDDEADRLHHGLMPLFTALFVEPSPMPLKAGLSMAWDAVGEPRLPLVPPSEETVATVREALIGLEGL